MYVYMWRYTGVVFFVLALIVGLKDVVKVCGVLDIKVLVRLKRWVGHCFVKGEMYG